MLDKHVLADEVSHLLKTKYKDTPIKDIPFNLAFAEVADKYRVLGESRGELKSELGSILGKRPKKRKQGGRKENTEKKQYSFSMLHVSNTIEFISKDGITFKFGQNSNDSVVLYSHSGSFQPSQSLKDAAQKFAIESFQLLPKKQARIKLVKKDTLYVHLLIDDKFNVVLTNSDAGNIIARVSTDTGHCSQSYVPSDLLMQAKTIAKQHFLGIHSQEFPGM